MAAEPAGPKKRRLVPILGTLILLGGSLTLAALVGELAVRTLAPQQLIQIRPDVWQAIDTLGWVRRPGVSARINTGERAVDIFTDRERYRVGRRGRVEAPTRVLLLGDSFMEALQVEYEQSLAGLLETTLPARLGRPVAIRNAGVAGWDPNQYLLQARQVLDRDTIGLVLVSLYLGNDVVAARTGRFAPRAPEIIHHFRVPASFSWPAFVDALLYPVNDWFKYHSQLFILLKARLQTLRMRLRLTEQYIPMELRRTEAQSPRWRITADICRDIADLARAHGAAALFVLVPAPQQVDSMILRQYERGFGLETGALDPDQPTRLLGAALRADSLAVVDPLPAFRAARRAGSLLYGRVDSHLTPEGHRVLEQAVGGDVARALNEAPAHGIVGRRVRSSTASGRGR